MQLAIHYVNLPRVVSRLIEGAYASESSIEMGTLGQYFQLSPLGALMLFYTFGLSETRG